MAFDMFSTRTMMPMVEEGRTTNHTWLRDRYFSNRVPFDTEYIEFDVVDQRGRKLPPFVNPRASGTLSTREGYKTLSYKAPELGPTRVTTAEDVLKRAPGETIYTNSTPMERAAKIMGQDFKEMDEDIGRREEAMCTEALFKGKVTVAGAGLGFDEICYWSHLSAGKQPKTTFTTKWNASGTTCQDIMKDLRGVRQLMIKQGGFTPTELICGTKVLDLLLGKFTKDDAFDKRKVDVGAINPQHLPNGVSYWGYLADSNLDIYSYDEWYTSEAGADVAMVPENLCLLASPNVRTMMAYSAVGIVDEREAGGLMIVPGARVPTSWVQHANPTGRILQIKSRPLPVIQQIYGFRVIDALSSS